MLLVFASAVFLGSEFLETRDHILLSQFRNFHFRRLLRLAGSRWRYSTPPPHGSLTELTLSLAYNIWARTTQKIKLFYCCVPVCYCGNVFTEPLPRNSPGISISLLLNSNSSTCYNTYTNLTIWDTSDNALRTFSFIVGNFCMFNMTEDI
jgi:hypothetical protein